MSVIDPPTTPGDHAPTVTGTDGGEGGPSWSARYGERHRFRRVTEFPEGVQVPRRVRIYHRSGGLLLQWWDAGLKRNTAERVDGDLISAIVRARQVEEKLLHFKSAGPTSRRRVTHAELVSAFQADLSKRADAGDVDPATVRRYTAALGHFLAFCEQPAVVRGHPYAAGVNREFRLKLTAFLAQRQVTSNGNSQAKGRPMKAQGFVLDTVRATYQWAGDPERGNLMPEGSHNPFLRHSESRVVHMGDPLAEPDVTLPMAIDFVRVCDDYQLRLFVPLLLFGLRAAEPCFLFAEYLDGQWLRVPCIPELADQTKGRRDKRFPLLEDLGPFWELLSGRGGGCRHGLLYERRAVASGDEQAAWRGASLAELVGEFRRRCGQGGSTATAAALAEARDRLLREAGGICYDHVEGEFTSLARKLGWARQATLKDFRHLFCTMTAGAAMPEAHRRYLMGHAPERAAISAYTHLHDLPRHYTEAVRREWRPLLDAVLARSEAILRPS
jgi:hypothetical protein